MKPHDKLPWEIIWQHDGHVTDVVLTSMADGQHAIVPDTALEHVDGCHFCSQRLGECALLSLRVDEQLALQETQSQRARASFPWSAVFVALLAAGLGMIPALLQAPGWLAALSTWLVQGFPLFVRSAALLARTLPQGLQGTMLVATLASAIVLTITGYGIARSMTRAHSAQGGA